MNRNREQIDAALVNANKVRDQRAELRARVRPLESRDGRYELAAILDENGEHDVALRSLPVVGFLKWSKRLRAEVLRRYLAEAGCTEYKTIGELSPRQRAALAEALRLSPEDLLQRERDRAAVLWATVRNRRQAA